MTKKHLITTLAAVLTVGLIGGVLAGCGSRQPSASAEGTAQMEIREKGGVICLKVNPEIAVSYDESGKVRGLLEVTDSMDGINIYSPIYENDLRAGLSLRKGPTFSLSARAFSPLSRIAFGFAVDLAYLPLFPYFNLLASFLVNYDGIVSYHGGLGAEVRLPLKSIINTRFISVVIETVSLPRMLLHIHIRPVRLLFWLKNR